jgi:hypothetical protein
MTSLIRRVSTSAVVIAAATAISLGGSTEAWGSTATPTHAKTSTWEGATAGHKTSTWEGATAGHKTSTWEG